MFIHETVCVVEFGGNSPLDLKGTENNRKDGVSDRSERHTEQTTQICSTKVFRHPPCKQFNGLMTLLVTNVMS